MCVAYVFLVTHVSRKQTKRTLPYSSFIILTCFTAARAANQSKSLLSDSLSLHFCIYNSLDNEDIPNGPLRVEAPVFSDQLCTQVNE